MTLEPNRRERRGAPASACESEHNGDPVVGVGLWDIGVVFQRLRAPESNS